MHPFIHPLSAAVDPVWESKSDWEIYKGIAKTFSEMAPEVLGVEQDLVLVPIQHDSPNEIAQPFDVADWGQGQVEPIAGKTMANVALVERDYPNLYKRFTALGPLMDKLGNGGKGIAWNTAHEVENLRKLNGTQGDDGPTKGMARIETAIDAAEVLLMLAPETNGEVAVKAWDALSQFTGIATTPIWPSPRKRRRSASATSRPSRARSSQARPGRGWRASTSATTPATPTSMN
jgi:nitrate reductase alpha subunit